eukprot:Gb_20784 [translate_table: standard]
MAPPTRKHFVEWEEEYVSNDRGSRVVHYNLKDRHGNIKLAVIGTERSLRHMVYVVADEFLHLANVNKSSSSSTKWRSRREVVDWLTSLLSKPRPTSSGDHITKSPREGSVRMLDMGVPNVDEMGEQTDNIHKSKGHFRRKLRATSKDIVWLGTAWTCRKHLRHYQSFRRNGITISVHDFVYVMAEGKERHIAYLEDMYEDAKARKSIRVLWFHKANEVVNDIPPPLPHLKEVFFTPCLQVLSVECVDGPATVLTPEHYDKCLVKLPPEAVAELHMCCRQLDNEGIRSFNLSQLEGYWQQKILSSIDLALSQCSPKHDLTSDSLEADEEDTELNMAIRKGPRKCRSSRRRNGIPNSSCGGATGEAILDVSGSLYRLSVCIGAERDCTPDSRPLINTMGQSQKLGDVHEQGPVSFGIGDGVELLSQDSGIRGCWFRCTVIDKQLLRLKVCYEDVQNEDETGNLEEWIPAFRLAAPDNLGIRIPGRPTVRPCPPEDKTSSSFEVGTAVDAWWNEGWWEGVVVMVKEPSAEVHVYFPGENEMSIFQRSNLRISRDWVNNQWIHVKETPNLAATLVCSVKNEECLQSATLFRDCTPFSTSDEVGGSVACSDSKSPVSLVSVRESSELEGDENLYNADSNLELKGEEIAGFSGKGFGFSDYIAKDKKMRSPEGSCLKTEPWRNCSADMLSDQRKPVLTTQGVDSEGNEAEYCASNLASDGVLSDLRWKSSKKRQRTREAAIPSRDRSSHGKASKQLGTKMVMHCDGLKSGEETALANNTQGFASRHGNDEDLAKTKKLRQGLKPILGCPPIESNLLMSSMPFSNLVMSR